MFSKGFFLRVVKSRDCGKELIAKTESSMFIEGCKHSRIRNGNITPVTSRDFELCGIADRKTSLLFVKADNETEQ